MDSIVASDLFHKMPRYVGPNQRKIYELPKLIQHMNINSGLSEGFTSVYSFVENKPVIDKVFFDADYGTLKQTLKTGKKIFEWTLDNNMPAFPLWSAIRGPHVYPLLKPHIYPNPAPLLKQFSYLVIEESKIYDFEKLTKEDIKKKRKPKKIPRVDTSVIGDIRRLCRYPNTQRSSSSSLPLPRFCIALDPERFLDMDVTEIVDLSKSPHEWKKITFPEPKKLLTDFDYSNVNILEFKTIENTNLTITTNFNRKSSSSTLAQKLIQKLIQKPCISTYICTPNPPSILRYAATIELRNKGLDANKIISLFKELKWTNYDEEKTAYQVKTICRKPDLEPPGKRIMQENDLCINNSPICKGCL